MKFLILLASALASVSFAAYAAAPTARAIREVTASQKGRHPAQAAVKCAESKDTEMPDADGVEKQIRASKSCYEAKSIAEQCGFGSSLDTQIAGAASEFCAKDFKKITAADKKILASMKDLCTRAYSNQQGTMFISFDAFCRLNADSFMSGIYTADQN